MDGDLRGRRDKGTLEATSELPWGVHRGGKLTAQLIQDARSEGLVGEWPLSDLLVPPRGKERSPRLTLGRDLLTVMPPVGAGLGLGPTPP